MKFTVSLLIIAATIGLSNAIALLREERANTKNEGEPIKLKTRRPQENLDGVKESPEKPQVPSIAQITNIIQDPIDKNINWAGDHDWRWKVT